MMSQTAVKVPDEIATIPDALVLTDQDRAVIARRARIGLFKALAAQAVMMALAVLVSWFVAGFAAGASALIGAAAYFVPNALFAMRLFVGYYGPKRSSSLTFFVGEALKLLVVGGVIVLVAWRGGDWLVWPAFLLGLLAVMKGYVLLLVMRRLP